MTLQEALDILGLPSRPTTTELETRFRSLIKTYHPDRNLHRAEWSHSISVKLNEAYSLVRSHVESSRPAQPEPPPPFTRQESNKSRPKFEDLRKLKSFVVIFNAAVEFILEGIHLYYNFGLENIHLRKEGVRHLRYRTALKALQKGSACLEELGRKFPEGQSALWTGLYGSFCRAFLENMRIEKTLFPDGSLDHKAYKHYDNGSKILDKILKGSLFPEDFSEKDGSSKSAVLCEQEFMIILTLYAESTWLPETVIKLTLLEALLKILKFETGMAREDHAGIRLFTR